MCERAVHDECDVVFVCGGDGTVMAAVTAMAGCDVPLAVLPAGTGNLLARNLDLPLDDEEEALRIGIDGRTMQLDVGVVDDRKFAVMAGLGFDAAMMRDAPRASRRPSGGRPISCPRPSICVDGASGSRSPSTTGTPTDRRVRTVMVGNVGKLQGGIPLLPDAKPDDGLLDVVLIAPRHLGDWLRVAGRVIRRADVPDRKMERFRGHHIKVEATRMQPRQLDGDVIENGRTLDIHVEAGALMLRVP